MAWVPPGDETYEFCIKILANPPSGISGQSVSFSLIPLCAVWDDDFTNYKIYQGVPKSVEWEVYETTESSEIIENYSTISFNRLFYNEICVTAKVNALFNFLDDGDESPLEVEIEGERFYRVVDKPEITFYVDKTPLTDSSKFYLGQKIQLSFKTSISIEDYTWEIDPPFVSEFCIIGENQGTSEIIRGKAVKNQSVDLLVYSFR